MLGIPKHEINRKLLHLSSLIYPLLYLFCFQKTDMLLLTGGIFIFVLFTDIIRHYNQKLNTIFCKYLKFLIRDKEKSGFTGSTYFMLGTFLTILLFPKSIAIIGLCVLVISDTSASIIGILYGKKRIFGGKSLEGSLAFFVSAVWVSCFGFIYFAIPLQYGVFASAVAMIAELFSSKIKLDDNILIPTSYSLTIYVLFLL